MGKAFVDKGRMMGQHDDKGIFRNLSQRFPDILFPFFGKGFITLGKAVISGGDIKDRPSRPLQPLRPWLQPRLAWKVELRSTRTGVSSSMAVIASKLR